MSMEINASRIIFKSIKKQTCLPAEMTWGKNDYNLGEDFEM